MKSNGYINIDETSLYYETHASGDPIVLLHGLSLNCRMWDPQIEFLSKYFQVITYDMRGYGKSSKYKHENYSSSRDLKQIFAHLGIKKAHLVGLSKGGGIGLNFAVRFPNYVKSLTLADSILGGFAWSREYSDLQNSVRSAAKIGGIEAARRAWMDLPLFQHARKVPGLDDRIRAMVSLYDGWHWRGLDNDDDYNMVPSALDKLPEFGFPVCIIIGQQDITYFHDIANILLDRIPKAIKYAIPEAGHIVNMEKVDDFNRCLCDFIMTIQDEPI